MFSHTIAALEKFDNQHEFERMSADILNSSGYKNVVLIAPRGGSDNGMDITFSTDDGRKGLACVTLQKDINAKFDEDFSKRRMGEFNIYILFCTAYLTASQKLRFKKYCLDMLQAEFVAFDIEALRSLLDSKLQVTRERYLSLNAGNKLVRIKPASTDAPKIEKRPEPHIPIYLRFPNHKLSSKDLKDMWLAYLQNIGIDEMDGGIDLKALVADFLGTIPPTAQYKDNHVKSNFLRWREHEIWKRRYPKEYANSFHGVC